LTANSHVAFSVAAMTLTGQGFTWLLLWQRPASVSLDRWHGRPAFVRAESGRSLPCGNSLVSACPGLIRSSPRPKKEGPFSAPKTKPQRAKGHCIPSIRALAPRAGWRRRRPWVRVSLPFASRHLFARPGSAAPWTGCARMVSPLRNSAGKPFRPLGRIPSRLKKEGPFSAPKSGPPRAKGHCAPSPLATPFPGPKTDPLFWTRLLAWPPKRWRPHGDSSAGALLVGGRAGRGRLPSFSRVSPVPRRCFPGRAPATARRGPAGGAAGRLARAAPPTGPAAPPQAPEERGGGPRSGEGPGRDAWDGRDPGPGAPEVCPGDRRPRARARSSRARPAAGSPVTCVGRGSQAARACGSWLAASVPGRRPSSAHRRRRAAAAARGSGDARRRVRRATTRLPALPVRSRSGRSLVSPVIPRAYLGRSEHRREPTPRAGQVRARAERAPSGRLKTSDATGDHTTAPARPRAPGRSRARGGELGSRSLWLRGQPHAWGG